MANYRTIRELKPYLGVKVFRLHKDGVFYYYAFEGDDQITVRSRKELHKAIEQRVGKKSARVEQKVGKKSAQVKKDGWVELKEGLSVYVENNMVTRAAKGDHTFSALVYEWDRDINSYMNVCPIKYDKFRRGWRKEKYAVL